MRTRITALVLGLGISVLALAGMGGVAAAQASLYPNDGGGPTPQVAANNNTPVVPDGGGPSATTTASTSAGALAFTGADIAGMVLVGAAAVGIGGTLVYRSRRSRATA